LSESEERKITSVEILVFSPGADGTLQYIVPGTGINSSASGATVTTELELTNGASIDLWVLANVSSSKLSKLEAGQSKSAIASLLEYGDADGIGGVNGSLSKVPIPMFGVSEDIVIRISGPSRTIVVSLLRMVSRVDLQLSGRALDILELRAVRLYHQSRRGLLIPTGESLSTFLSSLTDPDKDPYTDTPSELSDYDKPALAESWVEIPATDPVEFVRSLYTFESPAGVGAPAAAFHHNTCLVLETLIKPSSTVRYFRVDFAQGQGDGATRRFIPLIRNHRYLISITDVNETGGSDTPEFALMGQDVDLGVTVEDWHTEDIDWQR
jgi:hypothetical protein